MEAFFYICLFIFWTMLGSFWSVIIYRLKSWEWWITNGRSHCPKCDNMLQALDLIPIVSWVTNKARCKYCKEKVSSIYPILELSTWLLFTFIWYFLIDYNLIFRPDFLEINKLLFWLSIWFITILYTFYDILFLEIHEWIMLTWILFIIWWLMFQTIYWFDLIHTIPILQENIWLVSARYLSIPLSLIIIIWLYIIMTKEYSEWVDMIILWLIIWSLYLFKMVLWVDLADIPILNWITWALIVFIFFFMQIIISGWSWMWWWDLRIGIMVWLILWISFSFAWLMLTYMVWSVIWVAVIGHGKIKKKWTKLNTQIPFWPFLAIWFFLTVFYSIEISNIMSNYF